jgi:hypothetical protein
MPNGNPQNINGYAIERTSIGADDFFDVDFYDIDGEYKTAKIRGSVLLALVSNIFNSNGTLLSNRTLEGDFKTLTFNQVNGFVINSNPAPFGIAGVQFNVTPVGSLLVVRDDNTNQKRLDVTASGALRLMNAYTFPLADGIDGEILTTDGAGNLSFQGIDLSDYVNFGSTQWSKSIPNTTLANGQTANGISFFTDADKVVNGTTSYDEYNISYGRLLTLTGTSGTANININGVNYLATFNTTLTQTAIDFVTTHQATLLTIGIQVFAQSGVLKFGGTNTILNTILITTLTPNLSGTLNTAISDHIVIPYLNTAYNGQRLQHEIRVNFNIQTGSNNFYQLSLRRWSDDSIIGSPITIERNADYTGQQHVFITYTANSLDPFVTGGFYFSFLNNSGQNVVFNDGSGILIQTKYQKPTKF